MVTAASSRIPAMAGTVAPILKFMSESAYARNSVRHDICDFTFGNPQEMPLEGYVDALQKAIVPQGKHWFAYMQSDPAAQKIFGGALSERLGHEFEPQDVCLTNGAFAGLYIAINTIVEPGDEIIFISPHWFAYEGMIIGAGARAVNVSVRLDDFDLDLDAIQAAISPKTRAILVNTPHNPTGKIFSRQTLTKLANILETASEQYGRTIYWISDEAYHQIIFAGNEFISPATIYPNTLLIYTYGKIHLTPGQRVGFIALPPEMPGRDELRGAITMMQIFAGWAFPNALLQHAAEDLVSLSIDIPQLQARRDTLIAELGRIGYETVSPAGTFYLLVKTPIPDDWAFVEQLAAHDVYCLPGTTFGLPGYMRICLTATDAMIQQSIVRFAAAYEAVKCRIAAAAIAS